MIMTKEEYEKLAKVSEEDLANAWTDERGVKYSADRKRLLKASEELEGEYTVLPGTEVICNDSFAGSTKVTKVVLPEGVKCIGAVAFAFDTELTEVVLPEGLRFISLKAFEGCTKLWDINIPSSVEVIENEAFHFCKLKSFTFPKYLDVFYGRKSMPDEAEECFSETPDISVVNGCVIFENTLLRYYGKDAHVVIPEGVTAIGDLAFLDRKAITEVSIPSSVTKIGEGAFGCCESLQSIELPDSVTKIGIDTFCFCHSLQSVVLSKGLVEIPERAFAWCERLESIVIPDSVTKIGNSAFYMSDPSKSKALKSIDIPESVTSIGELAFDGCDALQTINIHGNPVIGKNAFNGCPGYKE